MKIHDITGIVRPGIWKYSDIYPDYHPEQRCGNPGTSFFEVFHGFNSQTGTYLETTAHANGYEGNRLITDVDVADLVRIPCRVLHLKNKEKMISAADIEAAIGDMSIPKGCAILFESGWDDWYAPDFVSGAPYLSREAMTRLLELEPVLMGSDTPTWQKTEVVFDLFAATDTLLLAPLVGLGAIKGTDCTLTVLPIAVEGTCCTPARAVIEE